MRKLTREQFIERLELKCPDCLLIGEFHGVMVKTLFRHKVCGHEFEARPNSILSGRGCPPCAVKRVGAKNSDKLRITREQFIERLELKCPDYLLIGEYTTNKTKTLFRHKVCGHEFEARPDNMLSGKGCPLCAKTGYKTDKPGYLYLLQMTLPDGTLCLKYGITNNIKRRLQAHRSQGMVLVVEQRHYADGRDALHLERHIKARFGGGYVTKAQMTDGYTETLSPELLGGVRTLLL